MALNVISLSDIFRAGRSEDEIKALLTSFKTINVAGNAGAYDVERFLHYSAITFEKTDIARTYLVMSTYKDKPYLAGYFAIASKSLVIPKRNFTKLSKTVQKRLMGYGYRTGQDSFVITGFLLGQLGKNYSEESVRARNLTGGTLLQLAYGKIVEAHRISGGRIVHLECEDNKVKEFYKKNGFSELEEFKTTNNLCIMVKKIEDILP